MKLFEYVNESLLKEMLTSGFISSRKHPSAPLTILTYTKECQVKHIWNAATEKCRGLIIDDDLNIIARPFKKFYNYEELVADNYPIDKYLNKNMKFDAYDELDGS